MTLMNGLDGNKIECKLNEFHCFDVNSLTCVPCQNIICGSDVDASCSRLLQYMNVRQTRQLAAIRCEYYGVTYVLGTRTYFAMVNSLNIEGLQKMVWCLLLKVESIRP